MSLAYFPMYADDFEADTAHLTLAEDGAYNRILRLCWRTPGCSIPSDRAWIYRRLRASSDEDKLVVDTVLDEFFTEDDGRFSNARLTREFIDAKNAHEKRKAAGAKGGKSKRLKTNNKTPSNAIAKPKQPEPEPEPEPDIDVEDAGAGAPSDLSFREKVLIKAGHDSTGLTATGRVVGGMADFQAFKNALADLGISEDEALQVVAEVIRKKNDGPPASLKYFIGPMQQFAGARDAPKLKAVVNGSGAASFPGPVDFDVSAFLSKNPELNQ